MNVYIIIEVDSNMGGSRLLKDVNNIGGSVNFGESSSFYDCQPRKTPPPAVDLSRENLLTFDSD